jgi:hypothetical protein
MPPDLTNKFPSFDMSLLKHPQELSQFEKATESFMKAITAPPPPDDSPLPAEVAP